MSDQIPSNMVSKSKPVRLLYGVVAAAAVIAGGLPLLTPDEFDFLGPSIGLGGVALGAFLAKATEDKVTPWEDVAAKKTPSGRIVAGPASDIATGAQVTTEPVTTGTWAARMEPPTPGADPDPGAGNGMNPPYTGV